MIHKKGSSELGCLFYLKTCDVFNDDDFKARNKCPINFNGSFKSLSQKYHRSLQSQLLFPRDSRRNEVWMTDTFYFDDQ